MTQVTRSFMFLILVISMIAMQYGRLAAVVSSGVYFLWIYSLASDSFALLPNGHSLSLWKLRIPIIYSLVYIVLVTLVFSTIEQWLIPFHIVMMISVLFVFYYASKIIVTAESGLDTHLVDYLPIIFGFWFFFIGVWFIQPKVQNLLEKNSNISMENEIEQSH